MGYCCRNISYHMLYIIVANSNKKRLSRHCWQLHYSSELYSWYRRYNWLSKIIQRTIIQRTIIQRTIIQRTIIQRTIIQRTIIQRTIIQRTIIQRTIIQRTIIQRTIIQLTPTEISNIFSTEQWSYFTENTLEGLCYEFLADVSILASLNFNTAMLSHKHSALQCYYKWDNKPTIPETTFSIMYVNINTTS